MTEKRESPEWVRLSLAAAMQLGYHPGRFHRAARMTCINLLLTYSSGCAGNCSYCGLAREREALGEESFIRVPWPMERFEDVVSRIAGSRAVKRTCIAMITHGRSVQDTIAMAQTLREKTSVPISVLISPTVAGQAALEHLRDAGVDSLGVAFDAPTEERFEEHRGSGVKGPHKWERYWDIFRCAVAVFGEGKVGSHFIVGLGETEEELVRAFGKVREMGGVNHLFSFFPEKGSALAEQEPPPMAVYRRIQIACELIDSGRSVPERFRFDEEGRIEDFGVNAEQLEEVIREGKAFMTRGCLGRDGSVACNRPYANSFPGDNIRNFPFSPESEDLQRIREQIAGGK